MTAEEKRKVIALIQDLCYPEMGFYKVDSYEMKALFEKLVCCYIGNADFINLMEEAGYYPHNIADSDSKKFKLRIKVDQRVSPFYWGKGHEPWKFEKRQRHHG